MLEHLVLACSMDRVMECGVAVKSELAGIDLGTHSSQRVVHERQVIVSSARRCQFREPNLEEFARLKDFGQTRLTFHQLVQHLCETAAAPEEHAASVSDFDEALCFEHGEGLAE